MTLFKLNHSKLHKTFKLKPEVQMSHRRRRRHFGPDWTLLFISFLNFPTCHSAELREEVQYRRLTAWQQVLETLRMCFQLDETRGRKKEKKSGKMKKWRRWWRGRGGGAWGTWRPDVSCRRRGKPLGGAVTQTKRVKAHLLQLVVSRPEEHLEK